MTGMGLSDHNLGTLPEEWIWGESFQLAQGAVVPRGSVAHDPPTLSFAQNRIAKLARTQPAHPALVRRQAYRLKGPLRRTLLESSLEVIVGRHESLRLTFIETDGNLVPSVMEKPALAIPVVDSSGLGEMEREANLRRFMAEQAAEAIPLTDGPLFRARLLHLADDDHLLSVAAHAIVADEASLNLLVQELWVLYGAFARGLPSPLCDPPLGYVDFAGSQTRSFEARASDTDLEYWKRLLGEKIESLPLPRDLPNPEARTEPDSRCRLTLDAATVAALETLSREADATLFMSLLTAFGILLYRHSAHEDIVIGCRTSGRSVQTRTSIGPFSNALVVHAQVSHAKSFKALLDRVRSQVNASRARSEVPIEILMQALEPDCDPTDSPLCQVGFSMSGPAPVLDGPSGLTVEPYETPAPCCGSELALEIHMAGSTLQLDLAYRRDRFARERMVEMLAQYGRLLVQIARSPEQPIDAYSLLTPRSSRLLPDPRLPIPEPVHRPVTRQFASWRARPPEPSAIVERGRSWSYRELADAADVLARALVRSGVRPGDVVAVAGEPGFAIIAAIMGALASGGVLLALDRKVPVHRQQLMLERASARFLLYVGGLQTDDWMRNALHCICVDAVSGLPEEATTLSASDDAALPEMGPDDPAYLFFTSGSTGEPKGILGCHKGLSHFLAWQSRTFGIGPSDRCAQLTGLSFDVVLRDIFTPLTSGATLCIPADEDRLDPVRLLSWMDREGITLFHTVPSVAQSWLRGVPSGPSLSTLRLAFFAGEPLTDTLIRRWRQAFPEAGRIVNLYGPTETTLAKCCFVVPDTPFPGVQPVGSPLPQTQALVLADGNRWCGIGEIGEIVLRTPFRSLGYIDADGTQQQRFVANPFRDDPEDLIYFTGDRGRYRPDGSLEILGRIDDQVKLRGVRIELGGIEKLLVEHPGVWNAVAVIREDTPGDQRLVAYVVPTAGNRIEGQELIRYLKQRVPDVMIPSACMILDALPLNANGKVDRRALPVPMKPADAPDRDTLPVSALEKVLAGIWKDVLHLDDVGAEDNFFDLGGHSLLVVDVQAAIRSRLDREVDVVDVFEYPTIRSLARHLGNAGSPASALPRDANRGELRRTLMRRRRQTRGRTGPGEGCQE